MLINAFFYEFQFWKCLIYAKMTGWTTADWHIDKLPQINDTFKQPKMLLLIKMFNVIYLI